MCWIINKQPPSFDLPKNVFYNKVGYTILVWLLVFFIENYIVSFKNELINKKNKKPSLITAFNGQEIDCSVISRLKP